MKQKNLFAFGAIFLAIICLTACSSDKDYELPSFLETLGTYQGSFTTKTNGVVTDKGKNCQVKTDMLLGGMRPFQIYSSELLVEGKEVVMKMDLGYKDEDDKYTFKQEQVYNIPGVTGYYRYQVEIEGWFDGRVMEFEVHSVPEDTEEAKSYHIYYKGKMKKRLVP